jgi:hypothetical protein
MATKSENNLVKLQGLQSKYIKLYPAYEYISYKIQANI